MWTFGKTKHGRMGIGNINKLVRIPVQISINRVNNFQTKLISAKSNHTFALIGENKLYHWGIKKLGRMGVIPNELRKL